MAALQARYPSLTGRRDVELHRLFADGGTVVNEVTVTEGEHIVHQVEHWPTADEPQPGRAGLTRPIERVPRT